MIGDAPRGTPRSFSNTGMHNRNARDAHVAPPSATITDVMPDHRLKLERDMLDYVRCVRTVAKAHDESTPLADAAPMLDQSRHRLYQCFSESGNISGRDLLVRTDRDVHSHDRARRPEVRTAGRVQRRHPDLDGWIGTVAHAFSVDSWRTCSRTRGTSSASMKIRSLSFIRDMA